MILAGVTSEMHIMVEETFGPAISIVPVPYLDTVLLRAAQSVNGLDATSYTMDARKVRRYIDRI